MTGAESLLVEAAAAATTVHVREATEADASLWGRYVAANPHATGYHAWDWRKVFRHAFGHESVYLIALTGGSPVGVLPLVHIRSPFFGPSLTSLPFLNYGGVVADNEEIGRRLVDAAADIARARRCPHVELRHVARQFPDLPVRQHKVTMHLKLEAGLWERLDRKVRNQIRKAQKSGLSVERGNGGLLPEFYAVFSRNMRDLGTPVYSPRLFAEVLAAFPGQARLHVVRLGAQPVAAGLTYRSGDTVEVPWASSVRDFNSLCPNHLLYWSIIETAIAEGAATLDFGRSTPHEGTYKFKEQWGAMPVPLHWEYRLLGGELPNLTPGSPKFRLLVRLWQRLPLKLAGAIGPHIVKGIP